jgi:uncharacterized radical SAM superfamily protein
MDQSVKMTSGPLNVLPHIIVAVEIKHVGHEIKSILIVLYFSIEASQIEAVGQVIFVDFAEIFVATRGDKLNVRQVSGSGPIGSIANV